MNQPQENKLPHNIIIENRKKLSISGVIEIESFEETTAVMITSMGRLEIGGENFRLIKSNTDTGELLMEGNVIDLYYSHKPDEKYKSKRFGLFGSSK